MSRDHFMPASFISRFGIPWEDSRRSRDKKVWVAHLGNTRIIKERASSFGYINGFYGAPTVYPGTALTVPSFDSWGYEAELNRVLDEVSSQKPIALSDWLHVLVPFVAGLFSRGSDFNRRYETLYDQLSVEAAANETWRKLNTNFSRHIRMERLLSAVMSSSWIVHHVPFPCSIISNDLGLATMYDPKFEKRGWAIPVDPGCVLSILPGTARNIGEYRNGAWYATLPHTNWAPKFFGNLNNSIAQQASSFIFGNSLESVACCSSRMSSKSPQDLFGIMDFDWGSSVESVLYGHRFDWYFAAAIADSDSIPDPMLNLSDVFDAIDYERWAPLFFEAPSEKDLQFQGIACDREVGFIRISLETTNVEVGG